MLKPVQTPQQRDRRLLEWLCRKGFGVLDRDEMRTVRDVLYWVTKATAGRNANGTMTEAQRRLVLRMARAVDDSINWEDPDCLVDPADRNAFVPAGQPVETPAVLRHLPLKPPGVK